MVSLLCTIFLHRHASKYHLESFTTDIPRNIKIYLCPFIFAFTASQVSELYFHHDPPSWWLVMSYIWSQQWPSLTRQEMILWWWCFISQQILSIWGLPHYSTVCCLKGSTYNPYTVCTVQYCMRRNIRKLKQRLTHSYVSNMLCSHIMLQLSANDPSANDPRHLSRDNPPSVIRFNSPWYASTLR
jgi:hypothetical protein